MDHAFTRKQNRVHLLCYGLLCILLITTLAARAYRRFSAGEIIPVDADLVTLVEQRIDPNTADWSELATLPQIGEITAKSIVAYREQQQRDGLAAPEAVFTCPEDLQAIRGIGEKTVARIAPHLKFKAMPAATSHVPQ